MIVIYGRRTGWLCAAVLLAATGVTASAARAERAKAVIELFTSQGCSSCPPADRLFAPLAKRADVITLSLPVDYWDRLGWKDTLAKPAFTARQQAYGQSRGDGQVYTPQAVLNGKSHFVGSSRSGLETALAAPSEFPIALDVSRTASGIHVSVAGQTAAKVAQSATVLALPIVSVREVAVGRGENANNHLTYTNVVREIETIASWTGQPLDLDIPADRYSGYDGLVVVVQNGTAKTPGAILGAARLPLR